MHCKLANEDKKKYADLNVSEKILPLCIKILFPWATLSYLASVIGHYDAVTSSIHENLLNTELSKQKTYFSDVPSKMSFTHKNALHLPTAPCPFQNLAGTLNQTV